ncbi:MAG: YHS domain-containing protein [Chloroflexi bacterium]|nr:YHS domain-containing protein [Chloroflexota bacterium]
MADPRNRRSGRSPKLNQEVCDKLVAALLTHEGTEYAFCGKGCLLEFRDDPNQYLDPSYRPSM